MSVRTEKVAAVLHRGVQGVLSEGLADPRLDGVLLTVVGVSLDDAVTTAVVRLAIRPDEKADLALHALASAAPHIRRRVADSVAVHRMPRLIFKVDAGLRKQAEVFDALARARSEAGEAAAGGERANDVEMPGPEAGGEHAR